MFKTSAVSAAATVAAATAHAPIENAHHHSLRISVAGRVVTPVTCSLIWSSLRASVSNVTVDSVGRFGLVPVPRLIALLSLRVVEGVWSSAAAPAGPRALFVRDGDAVGVVDAVPHVVLELAGRGAGVVWWELVQAWPLNNADHLVGAFRAAHHAQGRPGKRQLHRVRLDGAAAGSREDPLTRKRIFRLFRRVAV